MTDDTENDTTSRLMFEQMREDIKKLGEENEGGLRELSEQIKELDKKWAAKWSPQDLAMKNQERRIRILEQRRLAPGRAGLR